MCAQWEGVLEQMFLGLPSGVQKEASVQVPVAQPIPGPVAATDKPISPGVMAARSMGPGSSSSNGSSNGASSGAPVFPTPAAAPRIQPLTPASRPAAAPASAPTAAPTSAPAAAPVSRPASTNYVPRQTVTRTATKQ